MHLALVRLCPTALHQPHLLQALEQRGQGARIQLQTLTESLERRLLGRTLLPLPQHQHHQILRIGQAEAIEHRLVGTGHCARGSVELEAQLVVQLQRGGIECSHFSSASISRLSSSGLVVGAKRLTTWPSLPIRNLVKFHLMPWLPSRPGARFFSCTNSGWAPAPLTSTFLNSGKLTPKFSSQNSEMAPSSPGSCLPNWLQGKPNTTTPLSLYCCQTFSRPLYCGVKPHLLAVLTTSTALPPKSAKVFCSPLMVVTGISKSALLMGIVLMDWK